jgi:hypothetical protein
MICRLHGTAHLVPVGQTKSGGKHLGGEARLDGIDGLGASTGVLARVRVCVRVDKRVREFMTALTRESRRKTLGSEDR